MITLPELVPGFEEKQAGVCGPTASRRPLSPHCRSQLLVALADSARFSKRRRRSWKIYDRLLTIGSDRGQLASPANGREPLSPKSTRRLVPTPMSEINGNEACAAARPDDASPQRTGATDASSKTAGALDTPRVTP